MKMQRVEVRKMRWTIGVLVVLALACCTALSAQSGALPLARPAGAKVLMVSDIHFDPFWDPAKVQRLADSPVEQWEAILAEPESVNRAKQFADMQTQCHVKGEDTSFPLLRSSMAAVKAQAAGARFATVSGDLMAHGFDCKFRATVRGSKPGGYESFVVKTTAFVDAELRKALPGIAVFETLGNNDSDCADYQINAQSQFLADTGAFMTADVPAGDRAAAVKTFQAQGNYSVALPAPFHAARLLVIDNLFESARYKSCAGIPAPAAANDQIAWLRGQLEAARANHEKVWVMSHIPPGVDPYSTIRELPKVCAGSSPNMFLNSDALAATLASFGDVIQLTVFGHTHMDELRLLVPAAAYTGLKTPPVVLKVVPSISPVDGNNPSFMVAEVDPATAALRNYKVIASTDQNGTLWAEEYDYNKAYGKPAFDAVSVSALVAGFRADPFARSAASNQYLKDYFVGDVSAALKMAWPAYICALEDRTAEEFRACACR